MKKRKILALICTFAMLLNMAFIVNVGATTLVETTDDLGTIIGNANSGDIIELADGTHTVSSQINIKEGITLRAAVDANVTIQAATSFTDKYLFHVTSDPVRLTGVVIENITFIGNEPDTHDAENLPRYALDIVNAEADLKNITAKSFRYGGINVNNSAVTADGLNTSGSRFYGVSVSVGGNGGAADYINNLSFTASNMVSSEDLAVAADKKATDDCTIDVSVSDGSGETFVKVESDAGFIWIKSDNPVASATTAYVVAVDGTADKATHYATIEEAIAAAEAGDTVHIKEGTYTIASQVNIGKSISLIGDGEVILQADSAFTDKYLFHVTSDPVRLTDVKVENITFIGNAPEGQDVDSLPVYALDIVNAEAELKDITAKSFGYGGINVNNSAVTADGLNTSGNRFYGVSVAVGRNGGEENAYSNLSFTASNMVSDDEVAVASSKEIVENCTIDVTIVDANGEAFVKIENDTGFGWIKSDNPVATATTAYVVAAGETADKATHYATIEEAIAAAETGETVYIKEGTHEIASQININKSISLIGDGEVILEAADTFADKYLFHVTSDPVRLTDVKVENITFIGNAPEGQDVDSLPVYALDIVNAEAELKDITAKSFGYGGINVNNSAVTVDGLNTSSNRFYGVSVAVGRNGGEENAYSNLSFKASNMVSGDEVAVASSKAIVENCTIDVNIIDASGEAFVKIENALGFAWMKSDNPVASATTAYVVAAGETADKATHYATIEEAIAAAETGDTVHIKEGTYTIASQVNIGKSISLIGDGEVILQADSAFTDKYFFHVTSDPIRLTDLKVENITFIGNEPDTHDVDSLPVYALDIVNAEAELKDITAKSFGYGGINVNNSAVTADGLNTSGNRSYGVSVASGSNGGTADYITNLSFTASNMVSGDEVAVASSKEIVENCTIDVNIVDESGEAFIKVGSAAGFAWMKSDSEVVAATTAYVVAAGETVDKATHYVTIAEAIAAAQAGDTVHIKEGTYTIASQININKSISLIGDGEVILEADSAFADKYFFHVTSDPVRLTDVNVENITFIGNEPDTHDVDSLPVYALNIVNAEAELKDITAKSFGYGGINVNNSAVTVDGLNTSSNRYYGVNISKGDNGGTIDSVFNASNFTADEEFAALLDSDVPDGTVNITDMVEVLFGGFRVWVSETSPHVPYILSVTPNGSDNALEGQIVITFSKPMDISVGSIKLNNEDTMLSGGTWTDDVTYTIDYTGLLNDTTYVIEFTDFADTDGNALFVSENPDFTTLPSKPIKKPTFNGGTVVTTTPGAKLSQTTADFKVGEAEDLTITLTYNSLKLNNIKNGSAVLEKDKDYIINNNKVTFTKEYVASLEPGKYTITFDMSQGYDPTLTLTVAEGEDDTTPGIDEWVNPFIDVNASDWFYENVKYTVKNGLFKGITENTFAPNTSTTRGMIVTLLGRMENIDASSYSGITSFTDVKSDAYYAPYIKWASQNGIVLGMSDDEFAPEANISRQDLAVILYRYTKAMNIELPKLVDSIEFEDKAQIRDYAIEAVTAMQHAGIINGKSAVTFDPNGNATRAEVAAMLHRLANLIADTVE